MTMINLKHFYRVHPNLMAIDLHSTLHWAHRSYWNYFANGTFEFWMGHSPKGLGLHPSSLLWTGSELKKKDRPLTRNQPKQQITDKDKSLDWVFYKSFLLNLAKPSSAGGEAEGRVLKRIIFAVNNKDLFKCFRNVTLADDSIQAGPDAHQSTTSSVTR